MHTWKLCYGFYIAANLIVGEKNNNTRKKQAADTQSRLFRRRRRRHKPTGALKTYFKKVTFF